MAILPSLSGMGWSWTTSGLNTWDPSKTSSWKPSPQERLSLKRLTSDARARKTDEGLNLTIDAVRGAFIERDAEQLSNCLGSMKVYVSLKSRMKESGYYTRSQLQFMFDKMFQDLRTRSFEYSPKDIIADDNRANLRSEWTYVVLGSDKVVTESLHLTLEKEKDGWGISEIKASSR
jgi:hypothetical protein